MGTAENVKRADEKQGPFILATDGSGRIIRMDGRTGETWILIVPYPNIGTDSYWQRIYESREEMIADEQ